MLKFDEETTKLLEIAYQGGDVARRRRKAFDALHLAEGDTVIDIGCGNGFLTEEIARAIGKTGQVIGVDQPLAQPQRNGSLSALPTSKIFRQTLKTLRKPTSANI